MDVHIKILVYEIMDMFVLLGLQNKPTTGIINIDDPPFGSGKICRWKMFVDCEHNTVAIAQMSCLSDSDEGGQIGQPRTS